MKQVGPANIVEMQIARVAAAAPHIDPRAVTERTGRVVEVAAVRAHTEMSLGTAPS